MYCLKEELPIKSAAEKLWQLCENAYEHGSPWSLEQFSVDLQQEVTDYLVKIEEDEWQGFISYQQILDEVDISHIVVQKKLQGMGVGSQLLDQAIQLFKEQGIKTVFLEVRAFNYAAQQLYLKKNFETLSRRKKYYTRPVEDGIVMCLKIKEVEQ
ncbi:ribosomal protein S18-alanine N-acetyltransferase [Enterococcus sp. AZ192]|uniref:ribosomal protein S18-alanine N-acetyltransferase n=1 Tax=unclassified Enterococcus TaxID=2608891 RepID=UPI003D28C951